MLTLQGISKSVDSYGNYLFLSVTTGQQEIVDIHNSLYQNEFSKWNLGLPYIPHLTIGKLKSEDELMTCDQFQISVAFIAMGGILTTNYLNSSEPKALEKLNNLSNITLKMYDVEAAGDGFHTKGYIFKKKEIYRIIIGSSNMTRTALTSNREWNTRIVSTEKGEIAQSVEVPSVDRYRLQPNSMQVNFIANLRKIMEAGEERTC